MNISSRKLRNKEKMLKIRCCLEIFPLHLFMSKNKSRSLKMVLSSLTARLAPIDIYDLFLKHVQLISCKYKDIT